MRQPIMPKMGLQMEVKLSTGALRRIAPHDTRIAKTRMDHDCLIPAYLVFKVPSLHKFRRPSLILIIATGILLVVSPSQREKAGFDIVFSASSRHSGLLRSPRVS
jgi:hypothetical protein